jgi:cytidine deaminase
MLLHVQILAVIGAGHTIRAGGRTVRAETPVSSRIASPLGAAAARAAQNAHAPYSRFRVGAAILADDGAIFVGCNVENVSFPEGTCAETAAIAAMVVAGRREIMHVAVWSTGPDVCAPCGGCRQRIAELGHSSTIIEVFRDDELALQTTLGDLLPTCFGTASIEANRGHGTGKPK